jgi:hypothetical protein
MLNNEWRGLIDVIRVRAEREDGSLSIRLPREKGKPISPAESLMITADDAGLTNFDVHLSPVGLFEHDATVPCLSTEAATMGSWITLSPRP